MSQRRPPASGHTSLGTAGSPQVGWGGPRWQPRALRGGCEEPGLSPRLLVLPSLPEETAPHRGTEPGHTETCGTPHRGGGRGGDMGQPDPGARGAANPTPDPFSAPSTGHLQPRPLLPTRRGSSGSITHLPGTPVVPGATNPGDTAGTGAQARAGGTDTGKLEVGGTEAAKHFQREKHSKRSRKLLRGQRARPAP